MATQVERTWTAQLVFSCEHAGLRPHFKRLENSLYSVLARVDDTRDVVAYLRFMRVQSEAWLGLYAIREAEK
jgi:hypothetical protein